MCGTADDAPAVARQTPKPGWRLLRSCTDRAGARRASHSARPTPALSACTHPSTHQSVRCPPSPSQRPSQPQQRARPAHSWAHLRVGTGGGTHLWHPRRRGALLGTPAAQVDVQPTRIQPRIPSSKPTHEHDAWVGNKLHSQGQPLQKRGRTEAAPSAHIAAQRSPLRANSVCNRRWPLCRVRQRQRPRKRPP